MTKTKESGQQYPTQKTKKPGPRPAFSRDEITAAAIQLADAEGLVSVSMRRVAAALGMKAMSLYRYVSSRDELIDLMVDAATGEFPAPDRTGRWQDDLKALAHLQRETANAHPWMISVSMRSTLGPHGLAFREALLGTVEPCGWSVDQMLLVVLSVSTFVRGYVAEEIAERQVFERTGVTRVQWMEAQTKYVSALREIGKYSLFIRVIDEAKLPHDPELLKERFERGLEFLFDGIALHQADCTKKAVQTLC